MILNIGSGRPKIFVGQYNNVGNFIPNSEVELLRWIDQFLTKKPPFQSGTSGQPELIPYCHYSTKKGSCVYCSEIQIAIRDILAFLSTCEQRTYRRGNSS